MGDREYWNLSITRGLITKKKVVNNLEVSRSELDRSSI